MWGQGDVLEQRSPYFLASGTGFIKDNFFMVGGGDGSGSNGSNGELWGMANEASSVCPLLTSCSASQILTG